jgi:hypothetical protein
MWAGTVAILAAQRVASPTMADAKGESRVDEVVFDTVIVDEAARANPLDLMIPLIHASRRIVFVGVRRAIHRAAGQLPLTLNCICDSRAHRDSRSGGEH